MFSLSKALQAAKAMTFGIYVDLRAFSLKTAPKENKEIRTKIVFKDYNLELVYTKDISLFQLIAGTNLDVVLNKDIHDIHVIRA